MAKAKGLAAAGDFAIRPDHAYLNTASICLTYRGATAALTDWFRRVSEGGTDALDEEAEEAVFRALHSAAAALFGARPQDIAVGSSATELIASLAWAIAPEPGSTIVSCEAAFPSTAYPWRRVAEHTGAQMRWARDPATTEDVIALIDDRTSVVTVSHVEYRTGYRYDLEALAEACRGEGALLVVDATQSAGALPIDVSSTDVDALITGAYKWLCGPFGAAVMYLAPRHQSLLRPGLVGFRSHESMWDLRADRLDLPEDASRFEFSTMGYGCAAGLAAAIDYVNGIGVPRIQDWNTRLASLLRDGLADLGADIVGPPGDAASSIVGASLTGADADAIARSLADAGVSASARMGAVRFSPHLYNDEDDVERAIDALRSAL